MRAHGGLTRARTAGANCLRIVPNSAVKFLTYEHVSRRARSQPTCRAAAPSALAHIAVGPSSCISRTLAVRRYILEHRRSSSPDAEMTPFLRLGAGAVAGIIAMSATYPLDMVRGRLTVQADGSPSACVPCCDRNDVSAA